MDIAIHGRPVFSSESLPIFSRYSLSAYFYDHSSESLVILAMHPWYLKVHRHGILLFFMTSKFIVSLIPIGVLIWIFYRYDMMFSQEFSNYILLPTLLIGINYIFTRLILNTIDYTGRIMLIAKDSIILIHTSFILIDDIEYMDMKWLLKVDVERHGFLPNLLNYGHLILEQRNEVRKVHYVPNPHAVYDTIKNHMPKKVADMIEN